VFTARYGLYLCVLCGSQNKQRLFHCTALTDWFVLYRRSVFTARYELSVYIKRVYCAVRTGCLYKVCLLRGTDWVFIYNLRDRNRVI
jgi:hypothetical protein